MASRTAAAVAVLVGCAALIGWAFRLPFLLDILPGGGAIHGAASMGFLATGVSLWLANEPGRKGLWRATGVVAGAILVLLCLLGLMDYFSGLPVGLEHLSGTLLSPEQHAADRMSIVGSAGFLLVGTALVVLWWPGSPRTVAQFLAVIGGLIGHLALVGQTYGVPLLMAGGTQTSFSLEAALVLLVAAAGTLAAIPDRVLTALLIDPGRPGRVTRWVAIVALVGPWALGLAEVEAQRAGLLDPKLGLAVLVVTCAIFGLGLAFSLGKRVENREQVALRDQGVLEERVRERTQQLQMATDELLAATRSHGALASELQRLVDLVDVARDYISFADTAGNLLYLNSGGRKMLGIDLDEDVTSLRISDMHPGWANEIVLGEALPTIMKEGTWKGETAVLTRSGREIPTSQLAVAHRNEAGEITHLSTIIRDISDHKQLEVGLLRAMEKARAASHAKSEFLAAMSHEIRTPMNAIIGASDILAGAPLDAEYRHYVDLLHSASETVLGLIDDILDLSKIEARRMELYSAPFSPIEVCEQALDVITDRASQKGLELVWEAAQTVPAFVRGDAGRVRQILVNLLTNAVKYTESGEIALRLSAHPPGTGRLRFSVSDTGPGIDGSKLEKIFEAFTQASPAPPKQGRGVGLGLAISRNLAGLMGGKLWVDSAVGTGSTFWLELSLDAFDAPVPAAWDD